MKLLVQFVHHTTLNYVSFVFQTPAAVQKLKSLFTPETENVRHAYSLVSTLKKLCFSKVHAYAKVSELNNWYPT